MIGAIIGSAMSAAGSIYGGIKAANSAKKREAEIKAQRSKNQNWFEREANSDITQRTDAAHLINNLSERLKNRSRAAAGAAAVMGASEESAAATKAANIQALSQATAQIASGASARKDAIEAQYRQQDSAYSNQLNELQRQKEQNIANAVQGVSKAAGAIAAATDIGGTKESSQENTPLNTPRIEDPTKPAIQVDYTIPQAQALPEDLGKPSERKPKA